MIPPPQGRQGVIIEPGTTTISSADKEKDPSPLFITTSNNQYKKPADQMDGYFCLTENKEHSRT